MESRRHGARMEHLTPAQEAMLPVYRDRWIAIGLATGPVDRARATQALTRIYAEGGLKPPAQTLYAASPFEGVIIMHLSQSIPLASVRAGIEASVQVSVGASVATSAGVSIRASVWDGVGASVWTSVWAGVGASVGAGVLASVEAGVLASVEAGVLYGSMDAPWLAFYAYCADVLGIAACRRLAGLNELAACCGWWFAFQDVAILTDRPAAIHRDHAGRLHHPTEMAVRYTDGFGVWAWHGVLVPDWVITHPERITPTLIHQEENAEQRRILIERYGWERYVEDTACTLLSVDTEPAGAAGLRALYRTGTGEQVLICCCASTGRTYALDIPPKVTSCQQAAQWLAGTGQLDLLVRT